MSPVHYRSGARKILLNVICVLQITCDAPDVLFTSCFLNGSESACSDWVGVFFCHSALRIVSFLSPACAEFDGKRNDKENC